MIPPPLGPERTSEGWYPTQNTNDIQPLNHPVLCVAPRMEGCKCEAGCDEADRRRL